MKAGPGAILAAALLPPLGLHLAGAGPRDFWLGVALTALGFVPGAVFALHTLVIRVERASFSQPPLSSQA